jgi:hypothetical protein
VPNSSSATLFAANLGIHSVILQNLQRILSVYFHLQSRPQISMPHLASLTHFLESSPS